MDSIAHGGILCRLDVTLIEESLSLSACLKRPVEVDARYNQLLEKKKKDRCGMELFPFQSTFQFEVLNTKHEEAVLTIVFRCVITYPICIIYLTIAIKYSVESFRLYCIFAFATKIN